MCGNGWPGSKASGVSTGKISSREVARAARCCCLRVELARSRATWMPASRSFGQQVVRQQSTAARRASASARSRMAASCSAGRHAVGRRLDDAGLELPRAGRETRTMKNSSRLLAKMARNLHPLEQRQRGVARLVEHAAVELEPGQLAVEVVARVAEIGPRRRRRACACLFFAGAGDSARPRSSTATSGGSCVSGSAIDSPAMKVLLLLRHAKASREPASDDAARPLSPEGEEAAARMGRFLAAAGIVPDALLTSPALRARDTLERVAAAAGWQAPQQERPFYETTPAGVLASLRELPASVEVALAVGHEPTWSETASRLIGGGSPQAPHRRRGRHRARHPGLGRAFRRPRRAALAARAQAAAQAGR